MEVTINLGLRDNASSSVVTPYSPRSLSTYFFSDGRSVDIRIRETTDSPLRNNIRYKYYVALSTTKYLDMCLIDCIIIISVKKRDNGNVSEIDFVCKANYTDIDVVYLGSKDDVYYFVVTFSNNVSLLMHMLPPSVPNDPPVFIFTECCPTTIEDI
jgi:hypothetical protein